MNDAQQPAEMVTRSEYGPRQLCEALGLTEYQRDRAINAGIIPGPDTKRGRWKRATVQQAAERLTPQERAWLSKLPGDLGAVRAAEWLTQRMTERYSGAEVPQVSPDAIAELARQDLLRVGGEYKDHPIYQGRSLEQLATHPQLRDVVTTANHRGARWSADEAARYLEIRRSDLDHLIRAGLLRPDRIVTGGYRQRIALYRTADLDALRHDPRIDWVAVRTCPPGHPSPFRHLPVRTDTQEGDTPDV